MQITQKQDFDLLVEYEKRGTLSTLIVESSGLAIKVKTLDGLITSWNEGAEKIYGYKASEIVGEKVNILIPDSLVSEIEDLNLKIANGESITNFETKRIRKDGVIIEVSLSVFPVKDETGKIIGIVTLDKDISRSLLAHKELLFENEEKEKRAQELVIANKELLFQNEEKYKRELENRELEAYSISHKQASQYARSLIEASTDPLVTISPEGKITDVNEASVIATGETREKLIGTDFSDYFTEPQKAREGYKQVFKKGTVADYPLTIKHITGKLTDVLYNASVYKDDNGNVLGVFAAARDVTVQKLIATELHEAKLFAEEASRLAEEAKHKAENATILAINAVKAKQQFLSNMSHEIRTPMNAIIGFTKVLLKTDISDKQSEYLNAIKLSGDALIVLINDILDLAKVDAGKMSFDHTPFKMKHSISSMLHLFETKIQERNLKLIKRYDSKIPEVLVGDPARLHQIILNLVSNAVKFTDVGEIIVSVNLISENEDKVCLEFSIQDSGIGIAANKLPIIFEDFQQASSGTARLYGGTGLGLAIVKQLVEKQNGSISVTSELNVGSTFSFKLDFPKTKALAAMTIENLQLVAELKNIRVLVVEDLALNQLLMRTILEDFGFHCDIASNGLIAIEMLEESKYDIILMDLQMPEMNGFEATEYIRNNMKLKIPIIALTADVTTVDLEKCKLAGMNDYLAKPVDDRVLYSKMASLVIPTPILNTQNKEIYIELEKSKCTNLEYLMQRTKSNPILMMEMITLYLEQTPPLISAMRKSFQEKDWNLLQATAHKIIPSFAIMGINEEFENMAKKIQKHTSSQSEIEEISELVTQIENVCTQACNELKQEFNAIKTTQQ
jgi:PAS domain S-box-containing protein